MLELDHILWAGPDLDRGSAELERLTGVKPVVGGTHPGFGTRNTLAALAPAAYLEVMAPDPAQTLRPGSRAERISKLSGFGIITFAARTQDIKAAAAAAKAAGLEVEDAKAMSRTRPDGVKLAWAVQRYLDAELGEMIPFAIDWQGSPHPSTSTPTGLTLERFVALSPAAERLTKVYQALGLKIEVRRALKPGFIAEVKSPKGALALTSP